jgi:hypothetical protein
MMAERQQARRVAAMQTVEEIKGQMAVLQGILNDLQAVLALWDADDPASVPIIPTQVGVLVRELDLLRIRLERLTADRSGDATW